MRAMHVERRTLSMTVPALAVAIEGSDVMYLGGSLAAVKEGTLGRRLKDGADTVSVLGEQIIRRAEVAALDGFSAHADQRELIEWTAELAPRPRTIFLVHGEIGPMEVLAKALRERLGVTVHVPEKNQEFELWN